VFTGLLRQPDAGYHCGQLKVTSAEVIPNLRNHAMTTAEKRAAVFKRQHLSARKALKQLHHDMHMTYRHPNDYDSEEMSVLAWLTDFIDKAHADEYYKKKRTREDEAAVARKKVEEELKNKIRDEATAESELL
jgi:uncharacterized protein YciW